MDAINISNARHHRARPVPETAAPALQVSWARHQDEVREAQRLRHEVFAREMGACLRPPAGTEPDLDVDAFDAYCEHLMVRTAATADEPSRVVGTYRVMLPQAAQRLGRYYAESEFDLSALDPLRSHMAELGRSCIAGPWRTGGVILMLWSHLVRFLQANGVRHAIGCASIPMADGGVNAARLWARIEQEHLGPQSLRVHPFVALPVDRLDASGTPQWPALVKGYLRCGAQVLGAPAWDADFGTADLPMLLDLTQMPDAYKRRFAGV